MNRVFSPFMKSFFVAVFFITAVAHANEEPKVAKADVAKGEVLFANGDSARNIPACVSCHGVAGNSTIAQNPKLAAQHEAYTYKQLINFKKEERSSAVMMPYAKALSDEEIRNVAAYVSAQAQKQGAAKNKDTIELGKKIYRAGIAEKNVPACAACHGPNGAGIPAQYPRLSSQHQDYTVAQLINFRGGVRKNSPQMAVIAKRMSDDEMKAVADYVAGLK